MAEKMNAFNAAKISDIIRNKEKELIELLVKELIRELCSKMRDRGIVFEEHESLVFTKDERNTLEYYFGLALRLVFVIRNKWDYLRSLPGCP